MAFCEEMEGLLEVLLGHERLNQTKNLVINGDYKEEEVIEIQHWIR